MMAYHERQTVSGAVLTGGRSSRMGHDKALIEIQGESILERTLRSLSSVSSHLFIVGERDAYRRFGVPVLADAVSGAGPLGGIATALLNSPTDYMFIVGCDMPLLSSPLLQAMASEPRSFDALVPYPIRGSDNSEPQPLHALYSTRCINPIMARLKRNELKIQEFLDDIDVRLLDFQWLRQFDPDLRSFTNVNTPEDLHMVHSIIEQMSADGTEM
jgi:molybdenum cofactor guanylyltransferase